MLFSIICSFHFQVFATECQDVTLEHIDIGPNLSLLTFVHQGEGRHEYVIRDFDRVLSLVTVLNLHLAETRRSLNNLTGIISLDDSFKYLLHALAMKLLSTYEGEIKEFTEKEDLFVGTILGRRSNVVSRLLEDNLSYNVLDDFNNEFISHLMQPYFRHSHRVDYHTDYNQNTGEYESSQVFNQSLALESNNSHSNIISRHLLNKCPIQGDLEKLLSNHVDLLDER